MPYNKFIKENKEVIARFDRFIKIKLQDSDDDDNYQYISAYSNNLYTQINETIIKLDSKNCSTVESDYLKEQLQQMVKLYFAEFVDYVDWTPCEENAQNYFSYSDKCYIEPRKFTLEYVSEIMNKLNVKPLKFEKEETWFEIGIQFASGKVYELNNNAKGLSGTELKNEIFGKLASDNYRGYLDCSLKGITEPNNKHKNIFARVKAESELKAVIEHCKNKKLAICERFKEECRKLFIEI